MKYFVCSDIHSFYNEWIESLKKEGFDINNKEHIIILLGDLFDRGPDSVKCLDFVCDLLNQDRIICIRGNHEILLFDSINDLQFNKYDEHNGTKLTIEQFGGFEECQFNKKLFQYKRSLKNYYELNDYIMVHGWIPCGKVGNRFVYKNWRDCSQDEFNRSTWTNGFKAWYDGVVEPGKTIICGHTGTSFGHSKIHNNGTTDIKLDLTELSLNEILDDNHMKLDNMCNDTFEDYGIIGLDSTVEVSGKINICII